MSSLQWTWQGSSLAVAFCLLVPILAFSLYTAFQRLRRRSMVRWVLVAGLNVLAALSLAALLNPPGWLQPADQTITLVTEGAADSDEPGDVFSTYELNPPPESASVLLHAGQLPLRRPALGQLDIRGHGLESAELNAFNRSMDVRFSPPDLEGIVEPAWSRLVTVGAPAEFSGRFVSPVKENVEVELIDPAGQVLNGKRLRPDEYFSFSFRPRATGRAEYRVKVSRSGQIITEELVPLYVRPGQPLDILVLQSAPSFDSKQLSRWAGDHGSRVTVRTRISRDKWITQGVNVASEGLGARLPLDQLMQLDFLMVDARLWGDLEDDQKQAIASAVYQGLGLMIQGDVTLAEISRDHKDALLSGFEFSADSSGRTQAMPSIPGFSSETELPISRLEISGRTIRSLLRDSTGMMLEAWHDHGTGRVAISRLRERFQWVTSGDTPLHSAYWNEVLTKIARPRQAPFLLAPKPPEILRPGVRTRICALTEGSPLNISVIDPASQALDMPAVSSSMGGPRGCAFFWPSTAGWHTIELLDSQNEAVLEQLDLHVSQTEDWQAAKWAVRQAGTRDWFNSNAVDWAEDLANSTPSQSVQAIDPLITWLVFVVCASLLWIERRHDSED